MPELFSLAAAPEVNSTPTKKTSGASKEVTPRKESQTNGTPSKLDTLVEKLKDSASKHED